MSALLLTAAAVATSCGGEDFCTPGSYECTSSATTGGTSADGATGGSSNTEQGGSTNQGGTSGATAGTHTTGGDAGSGAGGSSSARGGEGGGDPGGNGDGGAADSAGGGEGGQGGAGPMPCDPASPRVDCVVPVGNAGIYVAPATSGGDDANDGTQGAPVATLAHAVELAAVAPVPIFVCAGTYQEHVAIADSGLALHGSYTCQDAVWKYDPTAHSRVAPTTRNEALRVQGVHGLEVTDLELTAKNANAWGASSVAVFVSGSQGVTFTRVHATAGDGMRGADGMVGESNHYTDDLTGNDGGSVNGGAPKECTCGDMATSSTGGGGGLGQTPTTGGSGLPMLSGGTGGVVGPCNPYGTGQDGASGTFMGDGDGAPSYGLLDAAYGWLPASGLAGKTGGPGQGGGGGAGASSGGGGGGACGGCGGTGGGGGLGGGGSIALLVTDSEVTLVACSLTTGAGKNGGNGAAGEPGQDGGTHGNGAGAACDGGAGGPGADGGHGGGGAGGISVGVVYASSTVTLDGDTTIAPGTPGNGGLGVDTAHDGVNGIAQDELEIL